MKLLEARLKQVENLLETRDNNTQNAAPEAAETPAVLQAGKDTFTSMSSIDMSNLGDASMAGMMGDSTFSDPTLGAMPDFSMNGNDDFSWEMIGLGLEEALPSREVIDELYG